MADEQLPLDWLNNLDGASAQPAGNSFVGVQPHPDLPQWPWGPSHVFMRGQAQRQSDRPYSGPLGEGVHQRVMSIWDESSYRFVIGPGRALPHPQMDNMTQFRADGLDYGREYSPADHNSSAGGRYHSGTYCYSGRQRVWYMEGIDMSVFARLMQPARTWADGDFNPAPPCPPGCGGGGDGDGGDTRPASGLVWPRGTR